MISEHSLQRSCVRWFRLQHPHLSRLLFAVPNGGARNPRTGKMLKDEGVVRGAPDLILLVPCGGSHALLIEMKKQGGRQSEAQKEFQHAAEARGYRYEVINSFDGFVDLLNSYLCEEYGSID